MGLKEKIEEKFKELIQEAEKVLSSSGWDGRNYRGKHPPDDFYFKWRTEALNLLSRVCGKDSEHFKQLTKLAEDERDANNSFYLAHCLGILKAANQDFKDDFLFEVRNLIRADLLDDFLSQAEYLFENNFFYPAASLAGAVLEDTLRKMCDMRVIPYPDKTKIEVLNVELVKAGAYDKLIQKEITAKADLRNNADHGNFDLVRKEDVNDMIRWIRRFTTEHLK